MLVAHFTAKRVLERHIVQTTDSVGISLFAVERPKLYVRHASWAEMEAIIRASIPADSLSFPTTRCTASVASETLKNKVIEASSRIYNTARGEPPAARRPDATFMNVITTFQSIIESRNVGGRSEDGQPTRPKTLCFSGGIHCETVLGMLSEFFANEEGNVDLTSVCKVLLLPHLSGHFDTYDMVSHRICFSLA